MYSPVENCQPVFKKLVILWAVHALQLHVICGTGQPMPDSDTTDNQLTLLQS